MDMPKTGGRWLRDPATGALRPADEPSAPIVEPASAEVASRAETVKPAETVSADHPIDTSDDPSPITRKKGK